MSPKITDKIDYFLVEPSELEYWEIWETLGKLFKMPEYPDKNVIWVFRQGPLKSAYEDLYKIKDFLEKNYPEDANPDRKVAIVVETGLHKAIIKEYVSIIKDLPIEFKIFSDLKSAEDWIRKN